MLSLRRVLLYSWLLLLLCFLIPLRLVEPEGVEALPRTDSSEPAAQGAKDKTRVVRLLMPDGAVEEQTMSDYLCGVVCAEMPARFEPEALKAQACAARTYAVRLQNAGGKHENADLCTEPACCQAWIAPEEANLKWGLDAPAYAAKIAAAVAETDGLGVLYGGAPIDAVFFSSAPGMTTAAADVWGSSVAYLQSVPSPEGDEVPDYRTAVTLTPAQVREKLLAPYPAADLSGSPAGWFADLRGREGGAVTSALVGGVTLTGNQVRSALGLRSPAFTVEFDGENFQFSVIGYGHGVGMSQYGANKMAREGETFRAILEWYYSGAEVGALWE